MSSPTRRNLVIFAVALALGVVALKGVGARNSSTVMLPAPALDEARTSATEQTAVLAGGCFWGVQAIFQHVKGVKSAVSGYAGGLINAPTYALVSMGTTGHAESVRITYDPAIVTYGTLLKAFFSVAHDPTTLNRQGPDRGTQYRSAIFYASGEQRQIAEAYVAQLNAARVFSDPIVTQIAELPGFYPAEDYHQDYASKHPYSPYIMINDAPKIAQLKKQMPELWRD